MQLPGRGAAWVFNGRGIDHAPEPGHPAGQLPRLTVAMVAWLQGFSDSWEFCGDAGQLTGEAGMRRSCRPTSIQDAVSLGVRGISRTAAWAAAREPRETR